jgi:hypothetical protein
MTSLALTPASHAIAQDSKEQSATSLLWIAIHKDRISIAITEAEAQRLRDNARDNEISIGCREFRMEGGSGENAAQRKLLCSDALFITSRGVQGRAAKLAYDPVMKSLLLQDGVELCYESSRELDSTRIKADEMLLCLQNSQLKIGGKGAFQCELKWNADKPEAAATAIPTLRGGYHAASQQESIKTPTVVTPSNLRSGQGATAPSTTAGPSPPLFDQVK